MFKRIFLGIMLVLLVAVIGVGVYAFAFDKTIPTNWVSGQIEEVKKSKFTGDDKKMPSMKITYESTVYSKDENDKVTSYFDTKYYRELKNKSTKDVEGYEVIMKNYDENGNLNEENTIKYYIEDGKYYRASGELKEEIENFNEVGAFFLFVSDFYKDDMTLKQEVVDAIDNKLDHVSQKGLSITLHLHADENDNKTDLAITYGIFSKKIEKWELTRETYTDGALTRKIYQKVEF